MLFMNEYEVAEAARRTHLNPSLKNLAVATDALLSLVDWTNANSDGWHSWPKPCRAAKSLQTLIQSVDRYQPEDVTEAEVKKALAPIKAFLTRQGASLSLTSR